MNISEKQSLKKALPMGWRILIAKETGYSKSYITQVLSGERDSFIIERAALKIAKNHREEISIMEKLKAEIL
ncbi:MAG: hypothetical protein LBJ39_01195 [Tannerellaceae bacterium]|jgi:transcriptional regulator|nr:hypothetical protein [Tannerellaceae bacterium]